MAYGQTIPVLKIQQQVPTYKRQDWKKTCLVCCPRSLSVFCCPRLNHISSRFLIPLSNSSLVCTVPTQWLAILACYYM